MIIQQFNKPTESTILLETAKALLPILVGRYDTHPQSHKALCDAAIDLAGELIDAHNRWSEVRDCCDSEKEDGQDLVPKERQ
mgnify:CR=1 FL=1